MQPLPIEMRHKEHIICLPSAANLVRDVPVKNSSETNSVLEVRGGYSSYCSSFLYTIRMNFFLLVFGFGVQLYYQIAPETGEEVIRLKALIDLFDEIVEEPVFNQLRYFLVHILFFLFFLRPVLLGFQEESSRNPVDIILLGYLVTCQEEIVSVKYRQIPDLGVKYLYTL